MFDFASKVATFFSIPGDLPSNAQEVLVLAVLRCGGEGPERNFSVSLWTEINSQKYIKYVSGTRYAQNAISFSSENMWFPLGTDKKLYIQCDDIQKVNCHYLELTLVGYR